MSRITLDCLGLNKKAKIIKIDNDNLFKRRLMDLGFIEGNIVQCVLVSPFKDPIAYKVLNTVIAVRKKDSKKILVEVINDD